MKYVIKNISDKTKYIQEIELEKKYKKGEIFSIGAEKFKVIKVL